MKLNDTHLVLLSAAAQRDDWLLQQPAKPGGKAAEKQAAQLESAGLIEAVAVIGHQPHWRSDPDGRSIGFRLLKAGFDALGIEADEDQPRHAVGVSEPIEEPSREASSPRKTKRDLLIAMLHREQGASIQAIVAATGWLPHSSRAALTGLRKTGHLIVKSRDEANRTIYRLGVTEAQPDKPADAVEA